MTEQTARNVDCVILNWKDAQRTARAVRSLASQAEVRSIYVVDNESDCFTLRNELRTIDSPQIRLLEVQKNLGFSAGVNAGLRAAMGARASGYVLIMNNDAWLENGSLSALREALANDPNVGVVGPRIVEAGGSILDFGHSFHRLTLATKALRSAVRQPEYLTWACVLVSHQCLRRVGLLDERYFMYWEDVEFGLRLRKFGFQSRTVRAATLYHETSSSHAKAGWKIHLFSAMGIVVTARILGKASWPGAIYRLGGRFAARVCRLDAAGATAVLRGSLLGLSVRPELPANALLSQRGVVR